MGTSLFTNTASLAAQRNLNISQDMLRVSTERLSSGRRVNSAKDDAAGIGIAKRFLGNVQGIRQGVRNALDGQGVAETGEAVLEQAAQMALRIRELAVQSQTGTYNDTDRANMNNEAIELKGEISKLGHYARYNGIILLNETLSLPVQYSDAAGASFAITMHIDAAKRDPGGDLVPQSIAVDTAASASASVPLVDNLLDNIASARASFGSAAVTLGYIASAQSALADAIDTARSRIEDTDYASETATMTRNQILQQAGTAALAQANAAPNVILSLIK
jgi:flagellin